jgi:hypothetical protein
MQSVRNQIQSHEAGGPDASQDSPATERNLVMRSSIALEQRAGLRGRELWGGLLEAGFRGVPRDDLPWSSARRVVEGVHGN